MRNPLLDSPVSRAGWLFATAVGLAVGLPLSTGPVRVVDGLIVCTGLPRWVFRRGGTCVGSVYLTRDNDGPEGAPARAGARRAVAAVRHAHAVLYAAAGRDPLRNRFEVEAGLEDGGYR